MSKYFPYNTHSPFVHIENSFIVLLGLVYENIYWQDIMRDHLFLNRRYSLQTYQSCYSVLSKKPSRGVSHSYLKKTSNIPTNMSYIPWTIIEQIYPLNDYWKLLLLQIHDYSHLWLNSILKGSHPFNAWRGHKFTETGGRGNHFLIFLHFFLRDSTIKGEFQCFRCLYQNQKFKKIFVGVKEDFWKRKWEILMNFFCLERANLATLFCHEKMLRQNKSPWLNL